MIHSIVTSAWINMKNLRFQLLQYLMLVVVFPCSYLLISVFSNAGERNLTCYVVSLFCSMLMSLFINMEAVMIANSNAISVIEQYATFQVSPLYVHMGSSLYHGILSVPLLLVSAVWLGLLYGQLHIVYIAIAFLLSLAFLPAVAMILGGLFRNPNIASPIISMFYMIIMMLTPFYSQFDALSDTARILFCVNPFAHLLSLYYMGFGETGICHPLISVLILAALCALLWLASVRRWLKPTAVEKLNMF